MSTRYYVEDAYSKEAKKLRQYNVCPECGEWLNFWMDPDTLKSYIACHRHDRNKHEGIAKVFRPPDEQYILGREEKMNQENIQTHQALVAKGIPLTGRLTKEQATTILNIIWKGAPEVEAYKAAMLCQDYGLHPLMKHVYLIKYDRYVKQPDGSRKKVGEDWTTVLGIGATRLMMSRMGSFSYVDDTPRIMSPEEQKKIFGKVDEQNIVTITKLRTKDGLEAQGYGKYPRTGGYLMGEDKGNSRENMAFIRSERNAFGRLFPDAEDRLKGVEVADEAYMETPSGKVDTSTGELVEGEYYEAQEEAPQTEPETAAAAEPEMEKQEPGPTLQEKKFLLDPDWVKEALTKLHFSMNTFRTLLKSQMPDLNTNGELFDIIGRLDKEQAKKVAQVIEGKLKEAGKLL